MRLRFWAVPMALCAGLGLVLGGCGGHNNNGGNDYRGVVCTQEAEPALIVAITDASTGAPIASGATVVATDGSFSEALTGTISTSQPDGSLAVTALSGVFERAGTYTVQVSRPGYTTSVQSNVVVTKGVCHVNTRTLTFALFVAPTSG